MTCARSRLRASIQDIEINDELAREEDEGEDKEEEGNKEKGDQDTNPLSP